jgi:uncharacterized membrane protein YidH (DUF202 family)
MPEGNANREKKSNKIILKETKTETYLSNERTFLSWIRVALSGVTLGFVIARFGFWLDRIFQSGQTAINRMDDIIAMYVGIGIIFLSGVIAVLAMIRFRAIKDIIAKGGGEVDSRLFLYASIATVGIAFIIIIYLLLVSQAII